MALADLKLPPITFKRAAHYTQGRSDPVRAIVNHRMVGTLPGTDSYFTNPATRDVSTHFGIGYRGDKLAISQYVPLDDSAYANGNYDPSGAWDNWGFKTSEINAQTISIEHQDFDGTSAGRGIVKEPIQQASIALQALLRYGSVAQWQAAGITMRSWSNADTIRRELQAMPVDGRHIVTHHDIAGRLKPYCWMPWAHDTTGFPRTKYVNGILAHLGALTGVNTMVPIGTETQDGIYVVRIKEGAQRYDENFAPTTKYTSNSATVGYFLTGTGYLAVAATPGGARRQLVFVKVPNALVTYSRPTTITQAALDAAVAAATAAANADIEARIAAAVAAAQDATPYDAAALAEAERLGKQTGLTEGTTAEKSRLRTLLGL
jgi:N-acetylmuramoyl-L-alanine amidase-like protein